MDTIVKKTVEAVLILLSIFLLGLFTPVITSVFITITTDIIFQECVQSLFFWLITVSGWIIAACYINEHVTKK
jgi:uncharacterized membrane protein YvlD (DUF360 family)